jgi:SAM-dependent methyltransferase
MRWQLRYTRNVVFALLPFPQTLRRVKRRLVPYPTTLDPWVLEQGLRQIELVRASGLEPRGRTVLELGSGWQPVIPLLFRLAGAARVIMMDSQRLLDHALLAGTARNLAGYSAQIARRLGVSAAEIEAALAVPEQADFDALAHHFGLEYRAPADAAASGLADASVDIVISRAVLEHVPPPTIERLFREFHRILAPDGRACHIIDNSDHWSHGDNGITAVNFLRYPDWVWPLFNVNPLDYQNRLRHHDYLRLLRETGYRVIVDASKPDPVAVSAVRAMRLAKRFRRALPGHLGVLTSYVVARPGARHTGTR